MALYLLQENDMPQKTYSYSFMEDDQLQFYYLLSVALNLAQRSGAKRLQAHDRYTAYQLDHHHPFSCVAVFVIFGSINFSSHHN